MLMKKFRNPVPTAKLREHTELRALANYESRWSSTFLMPQRYLQIRVAISEVDLPGLEQLLLTPVENK